MKTQVSPEGYDKIEGLSHQTKQQMDLIHTAKQNIGEMSWTKGGAPAIRIGEKKLVNCTRRFPR